MEFENPLNFVVLAILGAALLWAVSLVHGGRAGVHDDTLQRVLLLAGWTLFVGSLLVGFLCTAGVFSVLAVVLFVVGYCKYKAAERRALLWALTLAAEKGIPLEQAARAFADERSLALGVGAARLAGLLEAGAPLPAALDLSQNPVAADALLASRIGVQTGQLGPALRMSLEHREQMAGIMRNVVTRYFYVMVVLFMAQCVLAFTVVKIMPVFVKMFDEFELKLPELTVLTIALSRRAVGYWPGFYLPVILLFSVLLLMGAAYYIGWSRYELPLFHRFWRRRESALVLRALAFVVRQEQPLSAALSMLAKQYPKVSVAARLSRASAAVTDGVPWCDALLRVGLIREVEAGVLRSAERAGNLAWALDEMADSTLRRFGLRLRALLDLLFPILILVLGAAVALFVIGMFLPLVTMIQGLS